jgi:hypothetical protein
MDGEGGMSAASGIPHAQRRVATGSPPSEKEAPMIGEVLEYGRCTLKPGAQAPSLAAQAWFGG